MNYIVFDLEFNQDFSSDQATEDKKASFPFEILQIGAVKLDSDWNIVATFNRYIKPSIYRVVSPFITELTGITTEQVQNEEIFTDVFKAFVAFIEDKDSVFCSWGNADIKELYRSVMYYKLDQNLLPKQYIDIQPYASLHLKQPSKKLLRLQFCVEALGIPLLYPFHDAIHDAYYTAEIFKNIMNPSILPKLYDPIFIPQSVKPRQPKRTIDFDALIGQFEKMYQRPITEDEQSFIKLAYQMGKTGQFIK